MIMFRKKATSFPFLFLCFLVVVVAVTGKDSSFTTTVTTTTRTASFIPGVVPAIGRSTPAPTELAKERSRAISSGYGLYNNNNNNNRLMTSATTTTTTTQLFGKKKKKGDGSAKPKVQVRLLKHISGTGQAGDVIQVTPAFFQNKLRPTKSAELISDDQVAKEKAEKVAKEEKATATATSLREQLLSSLNNDDDDGACLVITKKAGPTGQLFGGINAKAILEHIVQSDTINDEEQQQFLKSNRGVKITALKDESGKKMRGDIKHTGTYGATIALTKDISADISITVESSADA